MRTKDPYGYEDQGSVWFWVPRISIDMGTKDPLVLRTKDPYDYEDQGSLWI